MYVQNRLGKIVDFEKEKILDSIDKAFDSVYGGDHSRYDGEIKRIMEKVCTAFVDRRRNKKMVVHIEEIQDCIEKCLMESGKHTRVAKAFVLYRYQQQRNRPTRSIREKIKRISNLHLPLTPYGYFTYVQNVPTAYEASFQDHVISTIDVAINDYGILWNTEDAQQVYDLMTQFKLGGPLRQAHNTETAHVSLGRDIKYFAWVLDKLLQGCAVEYDVRRACISDLPPLLNTEVSVTKYDQTNADFIVPDSRQGYISLFEKILDAFFIHGRSFGYSTLLLPSDSRVYLVRGINHIVALMRQNRGQKLSSVDCLDIMCFLAEIATPHRCQQVLHGLGDSDDIPFIRAKQALYGSSNSSSMIPYWRRLTHISVICNDIAQLPEAFWQSFQHPVGACGLVNSALYPHPMRIKDMENKKRVTGDTTSYGTRNECEVFLPHIQSYEELTRVLKYAYIMCKKQSRDLAICMSGCLHATPEQKEWLDEAYAFVRQYDKTFSERNSIDRAHNLSTCKAESVMTRIAGISPRDSCVKENCHSLHQKVCVVKERDVLDALQHRGFVMRMSGGDFIDVEIPCELNNTALLVNSLRAVEQLEECKKLQYTWSDGRMDVPVYYTPDEVDEIRDWLTINFSTSLQNCSFILQRR